MSAKLDLLKAATDFLYSKEGPEYGDLGGCGDSVNILIEVAKQLRLRGVKMKFGNAYFPTEGAPGGDPNAHAWMTVDGKRFDPSQHAHKLKVLKYELYDPENDQSDLLECIVEFDRRSIREWARKTLEHLQGLGFVSRR